MNRYLYRDAYKDIYKSSLFNFSNKYLVTAISQFIFQRAFIELFNFNHIQDKMLFPYKFKVICFIFIPHKENVPKRFIYFFCILRR